jgi:outer membrane lipoprotein SlyB
MKKVAVTVAVLALGLAACAKNNAANNDMTANDTYTENAASTDMNASMNDEAVATNALENASNSVDNAQSAVSNMADNTTTNK